MLQSTRRIFGITALLGLLLPLWSLAAQVATISPEARIAWGFDRSDLPPHPGVRFGVLPNGLRYAIMRNSVPGGGLSVRLRFDAGARVEAPREQGFMHLIEHLLFHGTANIPDGALPLLLAQRGMRHFTDINAFTSFEETVYRLDMTRSDAAARTAALLVMGDVAQGLQFTLNAARSAKQDVRDEIGRRDAVGDRILEAQSAFFLPGTAIDRGPVAGTRSAIRGASGQALRRLYDLHYRPERAVLIMVGDFDPVAVETEIAARFSNWKGSGTPPPEPAPPSLPAGRALEARILVQKNSPTVLTIATLAPLGDVDASAPRDAAFLRTLGLQMLNGRLATRAGEAEPPFAAADLAIYDYYSTARLARIEVQALDRRWDRALRATASELRRTLEQGFTKAELDERIAAMSGPRSRKAAPENTTPQLADAIADSVNRRIVFTAPAEPSGTEAYLARVRLADVNAAFRAVWAGQGPLIFLAHDRGVRGGEAAILQVWKEAFPERR